VRERWIREKGLAVFALWTLWRPVHATLEIDLAISELFDFDAVYARLLRVPPEKTEATVIALADLIAASSPHRRDHHAHSIPPTDGGSVPRCGTLISVVT
jgi:hypothetical protein